MSKRILLWTIALLVVAALIVPACAQQSSPPAAKTEAKVEQKAETKAEPKAESKGQTIELKVASGLSDTNPGYAALKDALEDIAAKSQGKVKFTYFPSGTLVKAQDAYSAALKGITDITVVQPSYFVNDFPLSQVMSLEPGFATETEGVANWPFMKEFLLQEWSKVRVIAYFAKGSDALITAKKPVRSPGDMQGMRIFAAGLAAKYIAASGATPVSMAPTELYEAMQKGIVDGAAIGGVALQTIKLAEVAKYITVPGFGSVYSAAVMRPESYEALPADVKAMFDKLADTVPPEVGKRADKQLESAYQLLKDKGGEVVVLKPQERADIMKVAMKVNDDWAAELDGQGKPGKKMLESRYNFLKKLMPGVLP